jgi:hypothetical protein
MSKIQTKAAAPSAAPSPKKTAAKVGKVKKAPAVKAVSKKVAVPALSSNPLAGRGNPLVRAKAVIPSKADLAKNLTRSDVVLEGLTKSTGCDLWAMQMSGPDLVLCFIDDEFASQSLVNSLCGGRIPFKDPATNDEFYDPKTGPSTPAEVITFMLAQVYTDGIYAQAV